MLQLLNCNINFEGSSCTEDNQTPASFYGTYDKHEKSVHISLSSQSLLELRDNLDLCIEDFKAFIEQIIEKTVTE